MKNFILKTFFFSLILSTFNFASEPSRKIHPFLFLTTNDIQRAKRGIKSSALFANLANQIIQSAKQFELSKLPKLETDWWKSEKKKPFMKRTSPLIVKNTHKYLTDYGVAAEKCAYAFLLTSQTNFADKAKQILLKVSGYPFSFETVGVGLYYGRASLKILNAYDILYDQFTINEHKQMDAFFMRLLKAVKKNNDYWVKYEPGGPLNNHFAYHSSCFMAIGFFYERPALVKRAISGSHGFEDFLKNGFHDDGFWLENSTAYHFVQLYGMLIMANMTANVNYSLDLYDYTNADGKNLKQGYDVMIKAMFPNGIIPPLGDAYGSLHKAAENVGYEYLYTKFREPGYAWLINTFSNRENPKNRNEILFHGVPNIPKANPPEQKTQLWPEHGIAALRTEEGTNYWNGKGWTAIATFGNNFPHHHADKLSIIIFKDNHIWLPDCEAVPSGYDKFGSEYNQKFNWQTLSHNTILVNWKSQLRSPAKPMDLIEFKDLPAEKKLIIGDVKGKTYNEVLYSGVKQLRTLIVNEEYLLDVFQVKCRGNKEVGWITHIDGISEYSSVTNFSSYNFPKIEPWQFIKKAEASVKTQKSYNEIFKNKNDKFTFDFLCNVPVKIIKCDYPREYSRENGKIKMRVLTAKGDDFIFVTLYRCGKKASEKAKIIMEKEGTNSLLVKIKIGDEIFTHKIKKLGFAQH